MTSTQLRLVHACRTIYLDIHCRLCPTQISGTGLFVYIYLIILNCSKTHLINVITYLKIRIWLRNCRYFIIYVYIIVATNKNRTSEPMIEYQE